MFWINNVFNLHYFFSAFSTMGTKQCHSVEAVTQKCSVKKLLSKISQKRAVNVWQSRFFNKVVGIGEQLYQERDSGTGFFPVNFAKSFRTPFFKEHLRRLLLNPDKSFKSFSFCSLSSRSKLQKQSPKGVLQKYALKIFSKYTRIYLRQIYLIKVQSDGQQYHEKESQFHSCNFSNQCFLERL